MSRYLVRRPNGSTDGPYTSSELRELAYEGKLRAADEISPMGETRWVSASKVGGIREIIDMLVPPGASAPAAATTAPDTAAPPLPFAEPTPYAPEPSSQPRASPVQGHATASIHANADAARRYSMLRFSASSLASYGWVLMALVFSVAIVFASYLFFGPQGSQWSALFGLLLGFALMVLMRHLAKSTERAGYMIAIVFLPLVAGSLAAMRIGVPNMQVYFVYITPTLITVGTLFGSAVIALLLIAIADFCTAHADIATNSWNRRELE